MPSHPATASGSSWRLARSSGLLFRSQMLTNVWGQQLGATGQSGHGRRQSLISVDSR